MKTSLLIFSLISSTSLLAGDLTPRKELLQDIKEQTKKCAVQLVSEASETQNSNVVGYKSVCNELKIISPSEAQLYIEGEWLTANITESAESDGGDLDDLTITNAKGQTLATKTNIAAYDSVLVAMAGDTEFKKIMVKQ